MTIEIVLETALRDSTSNLPLDPHARQAIADRLAEPGPSTHRRWLLPAAAAAAVIAVATAGVVLAGGGADHHAQTGSGQDVPGQLPGYAVPPSRYFIAAAEPAGPRGEIIEKIVRASDGVVVGTLPGVGGLALGEPQLSPDGRRAYVLWAGDTRLGYVNLITGKRVVLTRRTGEISSPTISADGSTLAYEWTPRSDGNDVSDVIIRDLATGHERVFAGAPSGPTAIPLALSPNGRRLALVPQTGAPQRRPLWVVRMTGTEAFVHPQTLTPVGCSAGAADEPRWTSRGLFAVWHCTTDHDGQVNSSDIVTVDPKRDGATVTVAHHLPNTSAFLELVVVARRSGPLFVTADVGTPADARVVVHDPSRHWAERVVPEVNLLPVS